MLNRMNRTMEVALSCSLFFMEKGSVSGCLFYLREQRMDELKSTGIREIKQLKADRDLGEKREDGGTGEKKKISGDWQPYGKFLVRAAFGKASITDLMIQYAERVAAVKY